MIKKIMMVVFICMFTFSAHAGFGAIFDAGIDGIKNLLKKIDFDGRYVDDIAQTFDNAAKRLDADSLLSLRKQFDEMGGALDDIKYDDFKRIFDNVVIKASTQVSPRVTNMIAAKPTTIVRLKRTLPDKLRRSKIGEIRLGVRKFVDSIVQKLNRSIDLGRNGDKSQKAFWAAWVDFSSGFADRNGYWAFIVDADGKDLDELTKLLKKVTDIEPDASKRVAKLNSMLEEAAESAKNKGDLSLKRAYDEWIEKCAGTKCI